MCSGRDCDFLKRVFQALPDLIFYKDTKSVYTGCNDAFAKLVGFPVDQVIGKTDFDLFPQDLAEAFTDCDKQVMGEKRSRNIEEWANYPDGSRVHVDTYKTPLVDADGNLIGVLGRSNDITRRTLAEMGMREAEAGFTAFFDFSHDFMFILKEDGTVCRVNQIVCDKLGYTHDEVVGMPVWRFHPEHLQEMATTVMREMAEGRLHRCEIPLISKSGVIIPVETEVAIGRWRGQEAVFGISRDISDRKRSEEAIQHVLEMQKNVMLLATEFVNIPSERMEEGISGALAKVGRLIHADRAYLFDYDFAAETMNNTNEWCDEGISPQINLLQNVPCQEFPEWVASHRRGDLVHIPDVEALSRTDAPLHAVLAAQGIQSLITLPLFTPDGCLGFVGFDAVKSKRAWGIEEVSLLRVLAEMFANFKIRHKSDREIRLMNAERGMLLDTMEIQVWYLKDIETYGLVNRAHTEFLGMPREAIQYKRLNDFLPAESAEICLQGNRQVFETKKPVRSNEWLVSGTGERRLFEIVKTPAFSSSGQIDYVVCAAYDITEKEQLQNDLVRAREEAERSAKLNAEFLADMSHEIRTPLNVILGYLQIMDREGLGTLTNQNVKAMRKSGEHLLELINDILNIIRRERAELPVYESEFNLVALIEDVAAIFSRKKAESGVDIAVEIPKDFSVFIRSDKGKIRQILMNLVGNALKFTSSGSVKIRVGYGDEKTVAPLPPRGSGEDTPIPFIIDVQDSGTGIQSDYLDKIFTPFVKCSEDESMSTGSGLGLPLSRRYARALGGDVTVESKPGKGSRFRISFFASVVADLGVEEPFAGRVRVCHPDGEVPRVLVVDDNASGRAVLFSMLACAGFAVEGAVSGEEALHLVKRNVQAYALILLDKRMPGMDGYETLARLRELPNGATVPVVLVTASGFGDTTAAVVAHGGNGMLPKPVNIEDLLDLVGKLTHLRYEKVKNKADSHRTEPSDFDSLDFTSIVLPGNLVGIMETAIHDGDVAGLRGLMRVVSVSNSELAQIMESLVEDFDYDGLTALLEKIKTTNSLYSGE